MAVWSWLGFGTADWVIKELRLLHTSSEVAERWWSPGNAFIGLLYLAPVDGLLASAQSRGSRN